MIEISPSQTERQACEVPVGRPVTATITLIPGLDVCHLRFVTIRRPFVPPFVTRE
jgi:hypothetical protein